MKVSDIVINKVDRPPNGYIFTYNDFNLPVENKEASIKVLNRLVEKGKLNLKNQQSKNCEILR